MKKLIRSEKFQYNCDTCGMDLIKEIYGVPITLEFGYGSYLDGTEYHFCSLKCLNLFIVDELKKQSNQEKE